MNIKRLVWIVVLVLIVALAFVGGFALGTRNGIRVSAYGFGARGFAPAGNLAPAVPFSRMAPSGYTPGQRMQPGFGMESRMMPYHGRDGAVSPRFAPAYGMRETPRGGRRMPQQFTPRNQRGEWR